MNAVRVLSHRKALVLFLLAALAAAFAYSAPLQAQEGTEYAYVDLLMTYEYDESKVVYSVQNIGTATATGVTVLFLLEDLQTDTFDSPNVTDHRTVDSTNQTFTWLIGAILPGETTHNKLSFSTRNHTGHTTWKRIGVITATASSNQPEPDFLLVNNVAKVYTWIGQSTAAGQHMSNNRLALLLSVDELEPDAGDDLNFDLTADIISPGRAAVGDDYIDLIGDIEIKVELSSGLEFKSTTDWTRPTGFVTTGRSATWMPDAVDPKSDPNIFADFPGSREIEIQTQLTSASLDDIPLEERCITAWVADSTPPPAADYVLGSLKQCLGDDPPVLFEGGELDLFTLYPCVGVSPIAYPCRDDNDDSTVDNGLELVAGSDIISQFAPRTQDVGRRDDGNTVYLRPGSVIIQVKDPGGRVVDSGNLAWWARHAQGLVPTLNNSSQSSADWTHVRWEIASVELPSSGHVHIFNERRSFTDT